MTDTITAQTRNRYQFLAIEFIHILYTSTGRRANMGVPKTGNKGNFFISFAPALIYYGFNLQFYYTLKL